jgi:glycosyltransferase involved in cell wall biosynthesis
MPLRKKFRNPKISLVIPSFNKGEFIERTLKSIVAQKYSNLEVLIYDGGSTDKSLSIIQKYLQKNPTVFFLASKKDKGQLDAIIRGLKKTRGEIIGYINADDTLKPGILNLVAQAFEQNPEAFWVAGFGEVINQNDQVIAGAVTLYKNILININSFKLLLMVNYLTQPAIFLSKKVYQKFGPFKGTKKYIMEYELWLRLGQIKMPIVIPKTLASFRLTSDNISSTYYNDLLDLDTKIAQKYTQNKLLVFLHKLHNAGRKLMVTK